MENSKNGKFHSPSKGIMEISDIVSEVASFVDDEPTKFYRLVIGTDSQTRKINGESEVDFVTAIIVHRIGRGARYFWKKEKRGLKAKLRLMMNSARKLLC